MMDTLMDNFNKKALEAEKLGAKALVLVVHDSAMAERLDLGALIREIKVSPFAHLWSTSFPSCPIVPLVAVMTAAVMCFICFVERFRMGKHRRDKEPPVQRRHPK